jgi:NADH:ubiquinone reductase (H+-translocating)
MIGRELHRIVVLGGGYSGLRAALDLGGLVRAHPDVRLLLIDRHDCHQLITRLHEVAAEALTDRAACHPFDQLLPKQVGFLQAAVTGIDLQHGRVLTARGVHPYQDLVVAAGSEVALPAIPGLREHGLRLRWIDDAVAIRRHVRHCFRQAAAAPGAVDRRAWLRFVIAGGGYTGCQLAGEFAHWLPDLADEHRLRITDLHLILLERAERLLPGGSAADGRRAEAVLRAKGVDIRLDTPLEAVDAGMVRFGTEGWHARTLVWAGGIRGARLLEDAGFPCGASGRVRVDRHLRAQGFPQVFVVGDSAEVTVGGLSLPSTAALALRQGAWVAEAIAARVRRQPLPAYVPGDTGLVVSLGGSDAAGDLLGLPLDGLPAALAKSAIEGWYELTARGLVPVIRI